jgi:hypothetical protein
MSYDDFFYTPNRSTTAPISGVYRYELIPAETPVDYYIDLFYVFGQGSDEEVLEAMEDTVYLKTGEWLTIDLDGNIKIQKKERHLKLVVTNG